MFTRKEIVYHGVALIAFVVFVAGVASYAGCFRGGSSGVFEVAARAPGTPSQSTGFRGKPPAVRPYLIESEDLAGPPSSAMSEEETSRPVPRFSTGPTVEEKIRGMGFEPSDVVGPDN